MVLFLSANCMRCTLHGREFSRSRARGGCAAPRQPCCAPRPRHRTRTARPQRSATAPCGTSICEFLSDTSIIHHGISPVRQHT
eukprot:6188569-Pleurochrysis_carterae.AAC.3